jgi:hypothetical protein
LLDPRALGLETFRLRASFVFSKKKKNSEDPIMPLNKLQKILKKLCVIVHLFTVHLDIDYCGLEQCNNKIILTKETC